MNAKRLWLILPAAGMPYVILGATAVILFSADNAVARYILETVFGGNGLLLLGCTLAYCAVAAALTVCGAVLAVVRRWDAFSLAKTAMIVKCLQIPAYAVIFVLGVLMMITLFTLPFVLVFAAVDYLTLMLTGLFNSAAVVAAIRARVLTLKDTWWVIALQFVFCADVAASVLFYCRLKKAYGDRNIKEQQKEVTV